MRFAKVSPKSISGLPYGYTEIAYLETTNQQNNDTSTNNAAYIDTGVTPDGTTKIECRVQFTTLISGNSNEALFGATGVNSSKPARMAFGFASVSPYTNFYMGLGIQNLTTSVTRDTNAHIFTIDASTSSWKIDNTTGTFSNTGEVVGDGPMYLFARNYAAYEYANKPANAKLYYCKIWKNNVLIRYFIPCLDSNNRPCMYDKVEGKPYYNSGSGADFTTGPVIIPISYLQSTGTQYCDTLYPMADIGKIDLIVDWREHSTSRREIMGSASSGGYCFEVSATGYYGVGAANYSTIQVGPKDKVTWTWTGEGDKPELYINDVFATRDTLVRVPVGNFMTAITDSWATNSKIYGIKIWNLKGELVRDIIPIRSESGTGYLFDKITHAYFGNQISGAFILGDDTAPKSVAKIIKSACTVSGLPYGYTEVEYLESSGTQYIDTEVIYRDGYDIESYFGCNTTVASSKFLFGVYTALTNGQLAFSTYSGWGTSSATGIFYKYSGSVSLTNNTVNKVEFKNKEWYYNGTNYGYTFDFSDTVNLTMYLFAGNDRGNPNYYFIGKMYSFKMYDTNNTLIRDYIPALDTNGKPCLYDKVTAKPYYNKGTGEFTYGKQIIPVEYLESTGEQYIDTGIDTTTQMNVSVQFSYTQLSTYGILFDTQYPSKNYLGIRLNGNNPTLQVLAGNKLSTLGDITIGTKSSFDGKWNSSGGNFTLNGVEYTITDADLTPASGYPIYIFAGNQQNSPAYYCYAKIYHLKISNGTTLVRDFIPVKDENDVGYMFDKIGHTLYANKGTGSFTLGNTVACGKTKILGSGSLVPNEYRQVEYIQSSESQWIDTGVYGNLNIMGYVDIEPSAASPKYPIGSGVQSNLGYWGICFQSVGSIQYYIGDGSYANPSTYTQGTRYKILINDNKKFYLDNELVVDYNTYATKNYTRNNTKTIILFGFNWSSISLGSFKFYNCKLWDNGILIRNFIPVVRKSDSKPGMYDRVNDVFYTNQGTGADFTYPSS